MDQPEMNGVPDGHAVFLGLWNSSLLIPDAEEAQRFIRSELEAACLQLGFRFWRPLTPQDAPDGVYVGVAHYDRNDLILLDRLTKRASEIVVFCVNDFPSWDTLDTAIPGARTLGPQPPFVASRVAGAVSGCVAGYAARQWLENWSDNTTDHIAVLGRR